MVLENEAIERLKKKDILNKSFYFGTISGAMGVGVPAYFVIAEVMPQPLTLSTGTPLVVLGLSMAVVCSFVFG